jgi:hypothetical protein
MLGASLIVALELRDAITGVTPFRVVPCRRECTYHIHCRYRMHIKNPSHARMLLYYWGCADCFFMLYNHGHYTASRKEVAIEFGLCVQGGRLSGSFTFPAGHYARPTVSLRSTTPHTVEYFKTAWSWNIECPY